MKLPFILILLCSFILVRGQGLRDSFMSRNWSIFGSQGGAFSPYPLSKSGWSYALNSSTQGLFRWPIHQTRVKFTAERFASSISFTYSGKNEWSLRRFQLSHLQKIGTHQMGVQLGMVQLPSASNANAYLITPDILYRGSWQKWNASLIIRGIGFYSDSEIRHVPMSGNIEMSYSVNEKLALGSAVHADSQSDITPSLIFYWQPHPFTFRFELNERGNTSFVIDYSAGHWIFNTSFTLGKITSTQIGIGYAMGG